MHCSSCGEIIKPVVALDIDGTLGDYHGPFIQFAERYLARTLNGPAFSGKTPFRVWFMGVFATDERTWADVKLAYRQGGNKRFQPVFEGARQMVREIRESGAEVWLTTTRPYNRLDNIDPDTRFWLDRQLKVDYDGLLFDDDKYKELSLRIDPARVVAILEDQPEQYDAASRIFAPKVPILRRVSYNSAHTRPNRADNLAQATIMIKSRLHCWRETHGG